MQFNVLELIFKLYILLILVTEFIWRNSAEYPLICKADLRRRSGGYG